MIRKTLICVVGVFAGASTGAYYDGFFEQENVVTTAYQQMASESNVSGEPNTSGDGSEVGTQDVTSDKSSAVDSNPPTSLSATASAASRSPVQRDAKEKSVKSTTQSEPASRDEKAVAETVTSVAQEKIAEPIDPATPSKTKDSSDDSQTATKSKNDEAAAENEKKEALQDAKSLALLNVRFAKETFKSPSGGELKYRKLTPRTGSIVEPLPLIVFLHGSGERGDDNVSQLKHGLDFLASREGMQKFPATIIAPQCPKDARWTTTHAHRPGNEDFDPEPTDAMRMTLELIKSIQITDNIDSERIYVTGLSMGGFGTFDIIARRPSLFAAAVPLCGGGADDVEVVDRIKKVPLWIIHGDSDSVVDVKYSRMMVEALKQAGALPRYSELAGFEHNIWDAAYADTELYKWLFSQSKSGVIDSSTSNQKSVVSKPAAPSRRSEGSETSSRAGTEKRSPVNSSPLQQAIQSDWQVLAATQRGRRADAATLAKMQVKFEGESMTIAIGDRSEAAKFRLPENGTSQYPWIDMISQRDGVEDSAGILAMQGDKLVICWGMPGANRPTTFDSKEGVKTLVLQKK